MTTSQNPSALRAVTNEDAKVNEGEVRKSEPVPQATPAAAQPAPTEPKKSKRGLVLPIILLGLLAGGAWYGYDWWTTGRFIVSTDDAYIAGDIATISPKVTGYVAKVNVVANQQVKAGDVLATLDQGDYQNALDQANAQIDTEKLALSRIDAQVEGARASLAQAQASRVALQAAVPGASG